MGDMYRVKLDPRHTAQGNQIKYGYLAYCGAIQEYGIQEAKKEAELFGGHIEKSEKRQKKEEQEYLVQYVCLNCNYEWSKYWSYAHNSEDCPKCDAKSIQGIFKEIKREREDIKFFELNITIRAGKINDIIGLIPRATGEFLRGGKIGSWCDNTSNYEFKLSEK